MLVKVNIKILVLIKKNILQNKTNYIKKKMILINLNMFLINMVNLKYQINQIMQVMILNL